MADKETMDTLLSIPMYPKYDEPVKLAAQGEGRTVAAYVRMLILNDLERVGLVDGFKEPIKRKVVTE
jgi:hypothetical protein